jgi:hypothetical protein
MILQLNCHHLGKVTGEHTGSHHQNCCPFPDLEDLASSVHGTAHRGGRVLGENQTFKREKAVTGRRPSTNLVRDPTQEGNNGVIAGKINDFNDSKLSQQTRIGAGHIG